MVSSDLPWRNGLVVIRSMSPDWTVGSSTSFFLGGANGNPPNRVVLWKLIHMILGDEVVSMVLDELGPTGEAYHPHPKNTDFSKPPSLGQDALYGTLEKSQGSCLVRHNELPSLKAEAKLGTRGIRMG